jgi:hypothetical protein
MYAGTVSREKIVIIGGIIESLFFKVYFTGSEIVTR